MMLLLLMLFWQAGGDVRLAAAAPAARAFWVLDCDMTAAGPSAEATGGHRVFRLGPKSFQEWKPAQKGFGSNLCLAFPCVADRERIEGTISSASLILTIKLDPRTGSGAWRTVGASGLARSSGACSVRADRPAATAG